MDWEDVKHLRSLQWPDKRTVSPTMNIIFLVITVK